jgi:hypothetical protein
MLDFNDDEIRRAIIEKDADKSIQEQEIKQKLEDIEYWYRIEYQVIQEKERIIKEYKKELDNELRNKKACLRNLYKSQRIAEVNKKYNISPMFNGW